MYSVAWLTALLSEPCGVNGACTTTRHFYFLVHTPTYLARWLSCRLEVKVNPIYARELTDYSPEILFSGDDAVLYVNLLHHNSQCRM